MSLVLYREYQTRNRSNDSWVIKVLIKVHWSPASKISFVITFDFTLRRNCFLYRKLFQNFVWHVETVGRSQKKRGKGRSSDHMLSSFSNPLHLILVGKRFYTCQLSRNMRVSRIRHRSPVLPCGLAYLPDNIICWAFMCLSLRFSPCLAQNFNFSYSQSGFWGIFARM